MPVLRAFAILAFVTAFYLVASSLRLVDQRRGAVLADRLAVVFCRCMLWLLDVRVTIERPAVATTGAALVVANHVSWIDILAFGSLPSTCFLAKSEVDRWPVISRFARLKGTVFVDRQRRRSIRPANATMAARLAAGRTVVIFPEGTTGDGTRIGRFHSSHLEAAVIARRGGVAVALQPVTIAYDRKIAAWIGDDALLPHLWSVLRHAPLACTLAYAAPIRLAAEMTRKPLAQAAHDAVEADLGRLNRAGASERDDLPAAVHTAIGPPIST